jgi:hypothetical protein
MYADPAGAAGGVRAAVWDHSMPIDASSMTLLALIEAIQGLSDLSPRDGATPP